MKNVMVCVTQQKTCERLIRKGFALQGGGEGELFVIHVSATGNPFLGSTKEGEALEYLYEKAKEYEADLTVVRSDDPLGTLSELIEKNKITHVILGSSRETIQANNFVLKLKKKIRGKAELIVVPPEEAEQPALA